jgi:hypothetical protein
VQNGLRVLPSFMYCTMNHISSHVDLSTKFIWSESRVNNIAIDVDCDEGGSSHLCKCLTTSQDDSQPICFWKQNLRKNLVQECMTNLWKKNTVRQEQFAVCVMLVLCLFERSIFFWYIESPKDPFIFFWYDYLLQMS